jgi:hypothetical protein
MRKIIDENKFDPAGFPIYQLKMQQVTDITPSENAQAEAAKRRGE